MLQVSYRIVRLHRSVYSVACSARRSPALTSVRDERAIVLIPNMIYVDNRRNVAMSYSTWRAVAMADVISHCLDLRPERRAVGCGSRQEVWARGVMAAIPTTFSTACNPSPPYHKCLEKLLAQPARMDGRGLPKARVKYWLPYAPLQLYRCENVRCDRAEGNGTRIGKGELEDERGLHQRHMAFRTALSGVRGPRECRTLWQIPRGRSLRGWLVHPVHG